MIKDFKYWDNEFVVLFLLFFGSWYWDEVGIYLYEEEFCEYEFVFFELSIVGCFDIGSFLFILVLICFFLFFEMICSIL